MKIEFDGDEHLMLHRCICEERHQCLYCLGQTGPELRHNDGCPNLPKVGLQPLTQDLEPATRQIAEAALKKATDTSDLLYKIWKRGWDMGLNGEPLDTSMMPSEEEATISLGWKCGTEQAVLKRAWASFILLRGTR
jgi:hypothetical protein